MKKKILIFQFRHETNSFSPNKADMAAYKSQTFLVGEKVFDALSGTQMEVGAFLDVLKSREDIEPIPVVALSATPMGNVTEDVFDFVANKIKEAVDNYGQPDAVLIELHGAMVAENHSDAEGDLLKIIREITGNDIPVISTLDLHANVTEKMTENSTMLVPIEKYPHTDEYETGHVAAMCMLNILDKKSNPTMSYRKIPYLLPLIPSESSQLQPLYQACKEFERAYENVIYVRFTHGFFASDIEEMGMMVIVATENDQKLADEIADKMEALIVENIPNLKQKYMTLDEVLDIAMTPGDKPVVIADASDNPGAGGLNDTTHILRRILERGITGAAIATILDPDSVKRCIESGVGTTLRLSLGGKSDKKYSGGPVEVTAYVKAITDGNYIFKGPMYTGVTAIHGITAVVEISGNTVLVTSLPRQPFDLEIFRRHGIAPEEQRILVTKSAVHYRASFGEVAREMHTVVLPGYSVPDPDGYTYKNWKGETH